MVHTRSNEKEPNPNKHINFITPLEPNDDTSRGLLRALAAQVRPVMKAHGFAVNSFEEYEYNEVFAGRNWNNGETVEIVLRGKSGQLQPISWLMSTLCHELAHIEHMNHGREFQALWSQLRVEVRELQNKGYYGDGYWSSGTRLSDSSKVGGMGIDGGEFPEYICGGAHTRARPTARRRRRNNNAAAGPSNLTGRQTAKRRKAGARITSANVFVGSGTALNADTENKTKGTGFGKVAASKRAREERALAAERRMKALQQPPASTSAVDTPEESCTEDESDEELPQETDQDRRQNLLNTMSASDLAMMKKTSWKDFADDFDFDVTPQDVIELSSDVDDDGPDACQGSSTIPTKPLPSRVEPKKKTESSKPLGIGKIVQSEVEFRKKESIGLAGGSAGRKIGMSKVKQEFVVKTDSSRPKSSENPKAAGWDCLVCTLNNEPAHLACSACATPRGDVTWSRVQA